MAQKREGRLRELQGLILIFVTIVFILCLATYKPDDVGSIYPPNPLLNNYLGIFGAWIAYWLYFTIGFGSYLIPLLTMGWGISCMFSSGTAGVWDRFLKLFLSLVLIVSMTTLLAIQPFLDTAVVCEAYNITSLGGRLGEFVASLCIPFFSLRGTVIILLTVVLLSLVVITEVKLIATATATVHSVKQVGVGMIGVGKETWCLVRKLFYSRKKRLSKEVPSKKARAVSVESSRHKKVLPKEAVVTSEQKGKRVAQAVPQDDRPSVSPRADTYKLPPVSLLDDPPPVNKRELIGDLDRNSEVLETTLKEFGISVEVKEVVRGPVITRYELQLAPGTKVQRITSLSDDIALAMKAVSVRIVAPIPGKSLVGIEVPNRSSSLVYLKELLDAPEMKASRSRLPLPIGKDVAGRPVIADLSVMPHLLIAGATGSGKSVCLNTLITSLLFYATPQELKFLLIDPKKVEFALYDSLPHLLYPVIKEAKKVPLALGWLIGEMERRYELLAKKGVRNIEMFNAPSANEGGASEDLPSYLPYIIVIIDELADLMLTIPIEVEGNISRLAQLARAVGIHMILSTQRPSVDVITGVIKANFPARVSFQVVSKVDSRTVLDTNGAEKLLGNGDLLFLPPTSSKLIRAQGAFIGDEEIERVIRFVSSQMEPVFDHTISEEVKEKEEREGAIDDELFHKAVRVVLQSNQASASVLQRRLRVGYARAARLIDLMEERAIVGPHKGSKPRDILVDREVAVDSGTGEEYER